MGFNLGFGGWFCAEVGVVFIRFWGLISEMTVCCGVVFGANFVCWIGCFGVIWKLVI